MITKISSYITSYFEGKTFTSGIILSSPFLSYFFHLTYSAVKRFRSDALVEIFMEYCGLGKF